MTIDKWIVLVAAICIIIALNVSFIRRMNRRGRDDKQENSRLQECTALRASRACNTRLKETVLRLPSLTS